jgi:hypothetical protein
MSLRITVKGLSVNDQWDIFYWHHDSNVPYYPSIDPRDGTAHYEFEDRDDAMRFKLSFGGTVIDNDL